MTRLSPPQPSNARACLDALAAVTCDLHKLTHVRVVRQELDEYGLTVDRERYVPTVPRFKSKLKRLTTQRDALFAAYALELIGGAA